MKTLVMIMLAMITLGRSATADDTVVRHDQGMVVLQYIVFRSGSAVINKAGREICDAVVALMAANPQITMIAIEAGSDLKECKVGDFKLSTKRAEAVRDYLVKHGVAPARLQTTPLAGQQPRADNKTAAGRQANRYVTFRILPPPPTTP